MEVDSDEISALKARIAELEANADLGLNWKNIPERMEERLTNEVPTFVSQKSLDVDGGLPQDPAHILIEGDNLHALFTLQATHKGKIDVVYIDPPYNTGREFMYNDKLIDAENRWRHSAWLSFMSKRLKLAAELMSEKATMFISINQIEMPRLWLLLEDIFGEHNVEVMIWHKVSESGSAGKGKMKITHRFRNDSEYVVVVYRNRENVRFNKLAKLKNFKNQYPNLDNDPRGPWISSEICKSQEKSNPTGKNYFTLRSPAGTEFSRQWHFDLAEIQRLDSDGRIFWGKGKTIPRLKKFVDEPQPTTPTSLIAGYSQTDGIRDLELLIGTNSFDNPKPAEMIQYLIEIASSPDSVILDFFAGSGTTLQAVVNANVNDNGQRQCILVTNNENDICRKVTLPRIQAILSGNWAEGEHEPLPGSLRFYVTDFVTRRKSLDRMRTEISSHTVDLVAVKEATTQRATFAEDLVILHGQRKTVAVVASFDSDHIAAFKIAESQVRAGDSRRAYLFTWSSQGIEAETVDKWPGWDVEPLPAEMLAELRKTTPPTALFDLEEEK